MATRLSGLLQQLMDRRTEHEVSWNFRVQRFSTHVAWHWEILQEGQIVERSRSDFASFADCARDANAHGFEHTQPYTLTDRPSVASTSWSRPSQATRPADARTH